MDRPFDQMTSGLRLLTHVVNILGKLVDTYSSMFTIYSNINHYIFTCLQFYPVFSRQVNVATLVSCWNVEMPAEELATAFPSSMNRLLSRNFTIGTNIHLDYLPEITYSFIQTFMLRLSMAFNKCAAQIIWTNRWVCRLHFNSRLQGWKRIIVLFCMAKWTPADSIGKLICMVFI